MVYFKGSATFTDFTNATRASTQAVFVLQITATSPEEFFTSKPGVLDWGNEAGRLYLPAKQFLRRWDLERLMLEHGWSRSPRKTDTTI